MTRNETVTADQTDKTTKTGGKKVFLWITGDMSVINLLKYA